MLERQQNPLQTFLSSPVCGWCPWQAPVSTAQILLSFTNPGPRFPLGKSCDPKCIWSGSVLTPINLARTTTLQCDLLPFTVKLEENYSLIWPQGTQHAIPIASGRNPSPDNDAEPTPLQSTSVSSLPWQWSLPLATKLCQISLFPYRRFFAHYSCNP